MYNVLDCQQQQQEVVLEGQLPRAAEEEAEEGAAASLSSMVCVAERFSKRKEKLEMTDARREREPRKQYGQPAVSRIVKETVSMFSGGRRIM